MHVRGLISLLLLACVAGLCGGPAAADVLTDQPPPQQQTRQLSLDNLPSGPDVLNGARNTRVARIALYSDTSFNGEDGGLIIPARFVIDLAPPDPRATAQPAPLNFVAWSTDGPLRDVAVISPLASVFQSEQVIRAEGTATIRIDASGTGGLFAGTPHYNLQIVDPRSGTRSNIVTVERPQSGGPGGVLGLGLTGLFTILGLALFWRIGRWLARDYTFVRRGDEPGAESVAKAAAAAAEAHPISADPSIAAYARSTEVPEIPQALIDAIAEGRGLLSIGTGCAGQAGLPTGAELMRMLVDRLGDHLPPTLAGNGRQSGAGSFVAGGPLGKGMDVLLTSVPRQQVIEMIAAALQTHAPDREFHAAMVAPPWRGIVSLAWDDLAFQAIQASGDDRWQRLRPDDRTTFTAALRKPEPVYLDLLGQLEFSASLSLSMDELRRNLSRNPEWQRGLALLMQSHTFLFIGTEPDVLELLFQTLFLETAGGDAPPRHFALVPLGVDNDLWRHSLARFGVALLPYGPGENELALREFIGRLRAETKASDRRAMPAQIRGTPQIGAISLRNIGPFETLDLLLATEPADNEQARPWTVIFGSNGMGKSTILRAMALALVGDDPRAAGAGAKLLKSGAGEGQIELRLGQETLRTLLLRDGNNVVVRPAQTTPVQAGFCLILGFPSLRGAPTPNPTGLSTPEKAVAADPADLLPLLHGTVDDRLGNFKQWLLNNLVLAGQGEPRAIAQRDLLDRIIRDIVPGDIDGLLPVGSDFILMVNTADGPVPFDGMSQGMASIFNWLGVVVQRLYQFYPDSPKPEEEEATVIVDEIDAHLHPDWQRRLVSLTKQNFPKLQVIATSHSPLLAGALHGQEMCILERNEDDKVAPMANRIDLFGQRSHDILISDAFKLSSDRNPEIEELHCEYLSIFQKSKRTKAEERRMRALERELAPYGYGLGRPPPEVNLPKLGNISTEKAKQLRSDLAALDELGEADAGGAP